MRIERLGVTSATSAIGAAPNDDPDRAVPDARLVLPLERARATIVHPAATTRTALRATIVHPVATRRTARRATVASRSRHRRVPDPMVDETAHRSEHPRDRTAASMRMRAIVARSCHREIDRRLARASNVGPAS
jgi:hypothetical protein